MKFKSLTLAYYRKYKKVEFKFNDGITAIIGKNGTGKSTIFEAILFALFGPIAIRGDKKVVRNRICPDEKTEVTLEFEIFGEIYVAYRVVKGVNDTIASSLSKGGVEIAKNNKAVNNEIKKIFGLDYKSFEISIFAKQGEISSLSSMDTGERRSIVPKLVGIDDIDKAIKKIKEDKKELSIKLDAWKSGMGNSEEIKETIANTKKDISDLEKLIKTNENTLSVGIKKANELKLELKDVRKKIAEANELKSQLNNAKKTFDNKKQELIDIKSKIEEIQSLKSQLLNYNKDKVSKRINELMDNLNLSKKEEGSLSVLGEYRMQINDILNAIDSVGKASEKLKELSNTQIHSIEKLEEAVNKIDEAKIKIEKSIAISDSKAKFHKDEAKRIEGLDTCPTCGNEKFPRDTIVAEHWQNEDHYKLKMAELDKKLKMILNKNDSLKAQMLEVREINQKKAKLESIIGQNKDKCDSVKELKLKMESTYNLVSSAPIDIGRQEDTKLSDVDYCKELLSGMVRVKEFVIKDIKLLSSSIDELKEQMSKIEVIENTIKNLKYTVDTGKRLKSELMDLKSNILDLNDKLLKYGELEDISDKEKILEITEDNNKVIQDDINSMMVNIGVKRSEYKSLNNQLNDLKALIKERKEKEKDVVKLGQLIDEMNTFKTSLLSRIRPQLNHIGSKLFEEITNGKYQRIELDENYDISVYSFGQKEDLTSFSSGGEMHLANICMRISISKLITNNFRCLVLDEIFGFQDVDRKQEIVSSLKRLIGTNFEQMLIITHDSFVKEKSDNIIKIIETEDGFNEIIYN